jgi:hypothetical protein
LHFTLATTDAQASSPSDSVEQDAEVTEKPTWDRFFQGIIEDVRPFFLSAIGEKWTNRFLGLPPRPAIVLPKIPQVKKDAKSIQVFSEPIRESHLSDKYDDKNPQWEKLRYHYLTELFQAMLKRQGSDEELSKWMNTLQQEASLEGIFRALVLNHEYEAFEKDEQTTSPRLIEFVKKMLLVYTNHSFSEEALRGMNVFSLKRIAIEKYFDVMDELKKNPEDLLNWYAVFSQDLATHYQDLFKEKIRKTTDPYVHKKWAKQMPLDFLKMEVAIKFSLVAHQL